jgi:flagellar protein FlgJ
MDALPAPSQAQLRATARKFEAQALNALLSPIFATVDPAKGRFGGGAGEAAFRPMLIERYAQGIANAGGIGLADAVYREMLRLQEGAAGAGARMAAGQLPPSQAQ